MTEATPPTTATPQTRQPRFIQVRVTKRDPDFQAALARLIERVGDRGLSARVRQLIINDAHHPQS